MRTFLNIASLIAWSAAAVTWTGRVREYRLILKKPVPRWAIIVTVLSWIAAAITVLSTFFSHMSWTSVLMSALWFLAAIAVLFTTVTSRKGADDGKRNQDQKN